MRWTLFALIGLGLVAALSAALLVAALQTNVTRSTDSSENAREIEIMVAKRALPAVAVIDAASVGTRIVKEPDMPQGALTSPVNVIGQVLVTPVIEGQPFTTDLFAMNEQGMHLSATLPKGMRAISVQLSKSSGLEGLLYPGSVVDVVATFRVPSGTGRASGDVISTVLLQGVTVLAVGSDSVVSSGPKKRSDAEYTDGRRQKVTLMVDSRQAEAVMLAANHGEVALTLRNPLDGTTSSDHGVFLSDISEELADRLVSDHGALTPLVAPEGPTQIEFIGGEEGSTDAGGQATGPGVGSRRAPETPQWSVVVIRGDRSNTYSFPITDEF